MSDGYGEEAEGVLGGRVDVRVKNCVLVMVEVMVAYAGTRNKGSRIKVNRIVIISSEREEKIDDQFKQYPVLEVDYG